MLEPGIIVNIHNVSQNNCICQPQSGSESDLRMASLNLEVRVIWEWSTSMWKCEWSENGLSQSGNESGMKKACLNLDVREV